MAPIAFTTIEYLLHGYKTLLVPCVLNAYCNILQDIDDAGGEDEAAVLRQEFYKAKNNTKNVLLTLYREVVQCLEEVTFKKVTETGKHPIHIIYYLCKEHVYGKDLKNLAVILALFPNKQKACNQ